jgi:hypothetical protein
MSRRSPQLGYDVAKRYIHKLQPLHYVVRQLLLDGLTGVDLLRTFVSCHIQPLRQWAVTMWMYPGPGCPYRSFTTELDDVEIDARI